jgi:sugar phosphate permease
VATLLFAVGMSRWWWGITGALVAFAVPGTWIGLVGLIANWIPTHRQARVMGAIGACYLLTDMVTVVVIEELLHQEISWRLVLLVCGVACIVLNIPALCFLKSSPGSMHLCDPPILGNQERPTSLWSVLQPLITKKSFWLLVILGFEIGGLKHFFFMYCSDYILNVYCNQNSGPDCESSSQALVFSILISLLFPLCGIASTIFFGVIKDGVSRRHSPLLLVIFLTAFLGLFLCMWLLYYSISLPFAILFVSASGFTLLGPCSLLDGALSLDVGGRYRAATTTGFVRGAGLLIVFIDDINIVANTIFCFVVFH